MCLQKPLPLSTAPALKPYCGTSGRPVNPACTREKESRAVVVVVGIVCSLPLALGRSWELHKYSTGRESLYFPHALTSVTQILMMDFSNVHFDLIYLFTCRDNALNSNYLSIFVIILLSADINH